MKLIDEIEAGEDLHDLWPTIKAALLAGEELMNYSDHAGDVIGCDICAAITRFRAATEGTK